MKRAMKPRATASLVVAPIAVSKRSAPAVLGVDERDFHPFLESIGARHVHRGHQVIALVADIAAAIERSEGTTNTAEPADGGELATVESILSRVGRRRVG